MRYSAVSFDLSCMQNFKGIWGIVDSKKPGWMLFAGGEQEVRRLVTSINRDEDKSQGEEEKQDA